MNKDEIISVMRVVKIHSLPTAPTNSIGFLAENPMDNTLFLLLTSDFNPAWNSDKYMLAVGTEEEGLQICEITEIKKTSNIQVVIVFKQKNGSKALISISRSLNPIFIDQNPLNPNRYPVKLKLLDYELGYED